MCVRLDTLVPGTELKYCYTCCHSWLHLEIVAHNPHNILKTYKDADRLHFQRSCWFWCFAFCILIVFIVHFCLKPINLSTGIHECIFICLLIFIQILSMNTCTTFHSLYPKSLQKPSHFMASTEFYIWHFFPFFTHSLCCQLFWKWNNSCSLSFSPCSFE